MKIVATRADVQVTMSLGNNILGLGYSSLPMFNHLMGLLLLVLHLLAQIQFKIGYLVRGILNCSIQHQVSFLLMSNAGDPRTETPHLG